jgi:hypothetical protein
VATCGGACSGGACELVIFREASHGGPESDRMSALRLRVARKVSYMKIHDAAAGETFNETLWGCFRCLWLWKKPLKSKATPSHPFRPPAYMIYDNTNTAFDKDSVANGAVEELAADVFDICYGYKGIQSTSTAFDICYGYKGIQSTSTAFDICYGYKGIQPTSIASLYNSVTRRVRQRHLISAMATRGYSPRQ